MIILAVFGLTLVWEGLATLLSSPLVRLGGRIASAEGSDRSAGVLRSLLLGVATGLL
jgi:hypothetical protein